MFTSAGQNIVAKYMLGQIPAFASYIAIGCGPTPLRQTDTDQLPSSGTMAFETFRGKVISRGYVNNGGTSELVLTAELPTDDRYEITEIGIFPSQSNDNAGVADSRMLLRFDGSEAWTTNGTDSIPTITASLDTTISNTITSNVAYVNSDNPGLNQSPRLNRQERPRFLNKSIFIRGNSTDYILLPDQNIDLSKNSPSDKLKLAFSIISNVASNDNTNLTQTVNIDFINASGAYYRMVVGANESGHRYQIAEQSISQLTAFQNNGIDPTLNNIVSIKITSSVSDLPDYWLALDGLRIDATSFYTPIYDLVAYKTIRNYITDNATQYARPIVKDPNTSNLIEFRFRVSV